MSIPLLKPFLLTAVAIVCLAGLSALALDRSLGAAELVERPDIREADKHGTGKVRSFTTRDSAVLRYRFWPAAGQLRGVIALFHGGGGHSGQPTFTHFIEHFTSKGFEVYGLDQRGHGFSDGVRFHVESMDQLKTDMLEFVSLIRADHEAAPLPVFGLGQSMGGVYLLDFSLQYSDALDGIIVTAPGLDPHGIPKPVQAFAGLGNLIAPRWQFKLPSLDYASLSRDPAEVERVRGDTLSHLVGTPRTLKNILATTGRVNEIAGSLSTPLFLAHGEDDAFANAQGSIDFFEKTPTTPSNELFVYEDAYHQLFLDIIKEDFFADVETWLDARLEAH